MFEGLLDDVYADGLAEGGEKLTADCAGLAVADGAVVGSGYGQDKRWCSGEECLVGGVKVVGLQGFLGDGQAELFGHFENGGAGDAFQQGVVAGCPKDAIGNDEDVGAGALGDVAPPRLF